MRLKNKIGRPERRPLEGARTRHQRPRRHPLRPERAALALRARAEAYARQHPLQLDGRAAAESTAVAGLRKAIELFKRS